MRENEERVGKKKENEREDENRKSWRENVRFLSTR